MNLEQIREIANAVLYEGYLLYPYRHSAIKNRQRWNFGVVYPRAYGERYGDTEPWTMRTQCLVTGDAATTIDVTVRFLHLLTRSRISSGAGAVTETFTPAAWAPDAWEEGVERDVTVPAPALGELERQPQCTDFAFLARRFTDKDEAGESLCEQEPLIGSVTVEAERLAPGADVFRLSVRIENTTPVPANAQDDRQRILLRALVSAHTILHAANDAFVSLLDPPEALREAAMDCRNQGTYPVLIGDDGDRDSLLSSPIILYDYPKIAPESAGSLFDGTEIDEILTLRILALSDEEKAEMRGGDARAREVLERTESLSPEQLMKLHGVIRSLGQPEGRSGG